MCGISGIINKNDNAIEPTLIEKMTDSIIHRGPDGKGYYYGDNFAFGHRRLAIIDLTDNGKQPMVYQGRYWIVHNGEVYNYIEIRKELKKLGYPFKTNTDTEVILAAYAHWGPKCLSYFNGMWAFAIYDIIEQNIFFARDRFGIKPLYYIDTPSQFAFGSEIKQLLPLQSSVRANRKIVIEALLTWIDGHTDDTYFEGIKTFPQSHFGYYDLRAHNLKIKRYYALKFRDSPETLSLEEAVFQFQELFEDSISIRLRSDVTVGTCLSGGLDSSSTSGIASRIYQSKTSDRFVGIHAKSVDEEKDESEFAKKVANKLGIDLYIVEPGTRDFLLNIEELVYTQEEPFVSPSMFMGWHVFQKAKSVGCKVMLNGQGGDEVLLGYERYFAAFLHSLPLLRFFREAWFQAKHSGLNTLEVLLFRLYFTNPFLRTLRLKRRSFIRKELKNNHDFKTIVESSEAFKNIKELQVHEISNLQLPHLLRYEDRNSMRHSIETRLPFLDYRLVEFCVSISSDKKIREGWTKFILRKAMENTLPKSIIWRKEKLGFEAPERTWIGEARKMMIEKIINSSMLKEILDLKQLSRNVDKIAFGEIWKYFILAAWESNFKLNW